VCRFGRRLLKARRRTDQMKKRNGSCNGGQRGARRRPTRKA
jgi:hypothetical protein